jgi:hypothetical protein
LLLRSISTLFVLLLAAPVTAQPAAAPLPLLDVPYISQSEALCGGAAAAMVLRFWGERGLTAESFAPLVDRSAAGIRTDALTGELRARGWAATGLAGTPAFLDTELGRGRPVIALIEDRPGRFHYVVVVGSTAGAVIFHDPAQVPFRTMARDEFDARWRVTDRWMAVVLPKDEGRRTKDEGRKDEGRKDEGRRTEDEGQRPTGGAADTCRRRVSAAVEAAQGNDLSAAETELVGGLACPGAARELAGVRLLQRRWPDVVSLATLATLEDARDTHAWRLLGTGRFVQNQPIEALAAWNRAGEPRVDRVSVLGLERTRHRIVETYLRVRPGVLVTPELISLAARRLDELPSTTSTRIEYVPQSGGLAEIRATVAERPLYPRGRWTYAGMAARAASRREVDVRFGSIGGGGEHLEASWRFWPERPRFGASIAAPAPWGGLWSVDGFTERQTFDALLDPAGRSSGGLTLSTWLVPRLRVSLRGALERRRARGTYGATELEARFASLGDRVGLRGRIEGAAGAGAFSTFSVDVMARSAGTPARRVLIGRAGVAAATQRTPEDIWFAGDTGHARDALLRAHPVLEDGRLLTDRLGRRIWHASGEAQQWWSGPAGLRLGAAAFADAARVSRRLGPGVRGDVDAGVGARAAVPGLPGVFRFDVAKGLRDGATAVSFVYDVTPR